VILAHNHPSGDPSPSEEDRDLTRRLAEAGRLLGIDVLDHVVVADGRHYSFQENGAL
jgi:DNA repair protein RadC